MRASSLLRAKAWRGLRRKLIAPAETAADFVLFRAARLKRMMLGGTTFIAITGSCGKSTTTKLASAVLKSNGANVFGDSNNTEKAAVRAILWLPSATDFCLQETGVDRKGTLVRRVKVLRPDIGIVTMIGNDHYKVFRTLAETAKEKGMLVEGLAQDGTAILNADDPHVAAMASRTRARVMTFGVSPGADVRAEDISGAWPDRLAFTVSFTGQSMPIQTRLPGAHWTPSVLAAIACGLACGFDLAACVAAIGKVEPVFGRLSVHQVPGGPVFVLDTFKAPLWTVPSTLAFLATARAKRKTVIFGTLSDYAGNAGRTYRKLAREALAVADRVILVGTHASHSEALRHEAAGRLFTFATAFAASQFIAKESEADELIMIKATTVGHLERIALGYFEDIVCWREGCGKAPPCPDCPHFRTPSRAPVALAASGNGHAPATELLSTE